MINRLSVSLYQMRMQLILLQRMPRSGEEWRARSRPCSACAGGSRTQDPRYRQNPRYRHQVGAEGRPKRYSNAMSSQMIKAVTAFLLRLIRVSTLSSPSPHQQIPPNFSINRDVHSESCCGGLRRDQWWKKSRIASSYIVYGECGVLSPISWWYSPLYVSGTQRKANEWC